ncbi:S41 family peptidase [Paenibacillus apiarius]|uniref:S41 family peptidase n=1 Tax=Paenibacillus apiarius TaxID=46240 RepID=A0ABT4DSK9_9BACL|nr:S41 family peptidase [Paenibacillus apiarius]MCY9514148.1 S41 family peptidase [Paenibacillus apiarius]MCY9520271.1 S41 family peptidase [Paenibacillus apiarius]MCY9550387.1 S41 family peptidase [Paenibacillus apiarius]MCY9557449.1 S41 family peptidase [Paenibacillus apiarius]MCY9682372.1 S41 family peptidase [Paenibacillus apiarius]
MSFKGRTVALLVGAAMLASSALTLTAVDLPIFASGGQAAATSSGLSTQEMQKLNSAMGIIENKFFTSVDREKLVNGAVHGMISSLGDPYSTFMEKEEAEQFNHSIEGAFTGIGAEVTMENGEVTVVSPIKGSPAEKAGVMPKDVLLSVNGESLEGKNLNEAVAKIRGPKGTKAKITIKRAGQSKPMELVVVRDEVDMETVYPKMLDDKIGYIEIRQFSLNTFERFKEELEKLEKQGMKGLVIDVRNNPGGVLDIVQKMTELFVPKGKPIVQVENRNKERDRYNSQGAAEVKPYPVTVLTNKGSASASEIMASALKESAGAKLVGEHTFGKGTVQTSYDSGDGGLIKITIAKWLTPNGNWIHQKGIEPDISVQQPDFYYVAPIPKDKTLKFDMNDADVKNAQIMLDGLGYKPGRKDGYFSKETETAIKAFQREHKLGATGSVDAKTGEQLEQAIMKAMRDPKNDAQLHKAVDTLQKEIR